MSRDALLRSIGSVAEFGKFTGAEGSATMASVSDHVIEVRLQGGRESAGWQEAARADLARGAGPARMIEPLLDDPGAVVRMSTAEAHLVEEWAATLPEWSKAGAPGRTHPPLSFTAAQNTSGAR
jgi:hypothetical protein